MATKTSIQGDMCAIVADPIDLGSLAESVRTDSAGAVALFAGVVRDHHCGLRVDRLEYEAYAPMAEAEIRKIIEELRARWDLEVVAIVHRTGRLEVGETSVAIAVSSEHRRDALQACAYGIDRLKESVPVWKKEHGEAGEEWVIGDDSPKGSSIATPRLSPSSRRRAGI